MKDGGFAIQNSSSGIEAFSVYRATKPAARSFARAAKAVVFLASDDSSFVAGAEPSFYTR